jgi:hypothetical protein
MDSRNGKTNDGIVRIQGQVSTTEENSQKGYRYLSDHWTRVLSDDSIQCMIKDRSMLGQIEHPTDEDGDWNYLSTPYDKASHIVTKAWVDSHTKNPWAELSLLNNEHGNNVKALLELGHQPGVSTRGLGEVKTDSLGEFIDNNGYTLITWDIVRSPNFPALRMKPVTDSTYSAMGNSKYKQYVEMFQLRDSGLNCFNRDVLLKQMDALTAELRRIRAYIEINVK